MFSTLLVILTINLVADVTEANGWGQAQGQWNRGSSWGHSGQTAWGHGQGHGGSGQWNSASTTWNKAKTAITDLYVSCSTQLAVGTEILLAAATFSLETASTAWNWGWSNKHNQQSVKGSITLTASDNFTAITVELVLTELSDVVGKTICDPEDLGNIIPIICIIGERSQSLMRGQSQDTLVNSDATINAKISTRRRRNVGRSGWGSNSWGSNWGGTSDPKYSLATISLRSGYDQTLSLVDLPYNLLAKYAGRGLALCETLVQEVRGWESKWKCAGRIAMCCRLGYSAYPAVKPTVD